MEREFREVMKKSAGERGLELDDEMAEKLEIYRKEMMMWNEKMNLTRITECREFAVKHVVDSLMVVKKIEIKQRASLIDVGTGPGFPGIPIKLYRRDINLALLESSRKKTGFLEEAVRKMELKGVSIISDRAESAARKAEHREKYDVAVARAVASLNVLAEICLPFVKMGGIFVAMKSKNVEEELEKSQKAIDIIGGSLREVIDYDIEKEIKRKLVVIEKIKPTPEKYPRKAGMPEKSPL
ncbi:16S rRNA (guanine(527)-N(7))-methyltransferase RsmG [Thermoanaerobacterium sp. DL9XJH110]|uniref:16S rRNA (guanine(527)-N(7))-methyltransferase RsmG n=1 Tax=Thermoanaerobacterium sp. DL9XJH110 TaxID=3386643 RepID=UPI003BB622A8